MSLKSKPVFLYDTFFSAAGIDEGMKGLKLNYFMSSTATWRPKLGTVSRLLIFQVLEDRLISLCLTDKHKASV